MALTVVMHCNVITTNGKLKTTQTLLFSVLENWTKILFKELSILVLCLRYTLESLRVTLGKMVDSEDF